MSKHNELVSIRPKVLLEMLENAFPEQNVEIKLLMPSSSIGSLRMIESALLVALTKMLDAQTIFEFGTFMGATTLLLAENSSDDTKVFTIDISESELAELASNNGTLAEEKDDYLRDVRISRKAKCIEAADAKVKAKISEILMNSHKFKPSEYGLNDNTDLIFVDGGHDSKTIRIDSENAFTMRSEKGAIIWHDYNSPVFSEVTEFLRQHPLREQIIFIEDTQMAIYWPRLLAELSL